MKKDESLWSSQWNILRKEKEVLTKVEERRKNQPKHDQPTKQPTSMIKKRISGGDWLVNLSINHAMNNRSKEVVMYLRILKKLCAILCVATIIHFLKVFFYLFLCIFSEKKVITRFHLGGFE